MDKSDQAPAFAEACAKGHRLFGKVMYCPFCGVAVVQPNAATVQADTPSSPPVVAPQKNETAAPIPQPAVQQKIEVAASEPTKQVQPPISELIKVQALEPDSNPVPIPTPKPDPKPDSISRGWLWFLLIPLMLGLASAIYFSLGENKDKKIDRLMKQARECETTPDWRCAADVSAQVLQLDPRHIPARSLREKALAGIEANDLVTQAQDCAVRNNWKCARQKSGEALRKDPHNAEAVRLKGRSEEEMHRKPEPAPVSQSSPPAPMPDLPAASSVPPRQEPAAQAAPQIDPRQIECKAMVKAGQKALASRSYDAAMDQAREALTVLNNCSGAKELEETARRMKKEAIGGFRME
ncbi:MAG: hypothetical protein ACYC05_12485 [Sulfuricella sp.]